jgi:hypothetical protein
LRAIQFKQWKKKRLIMRHLVALGSPPWIAREVYRRHRGWWNMSVVRGVTRALRNCYFSNRGLYDLDANWEPNHTRIWTIGPEQQLLPLG